ncbi:9690_t:CDS:2 [Diversispora eburnea]|uniref:9690_t:CDS:1 n=1 Tax=Diversispora eburnea TaxID=1213867 RepID=A0A9N8ZEI8_9GLOM|nr:9690_t:CDS:2 [Diversispora eburnea]
MFESIITSENSDNNNNNFLDIFNFGYFEDQEEEENKQNNHIHNNNNSQINQDNKNQEKKYVPKHDYDGCFHNSNISTSELLKQKFDMLEIAARSALKLGNVNLAVNCVNKLVSNEPGHIFFKGLVYARGEQYTDSIQYFIKYNQMRKNDYNTWKEIGNLFISCYNNNNNNTTKNDDDKKKNNDKSKFILKISLLCFLHAHKIMTISTWSKINFINKRFNNEKIQIEMIINKLKNQINQKLQEEEMKEIITISEIKEITTEMKEKDFKLIKLELIEKFGFEIDLINYILMECRTGININEEDESTEKLTNQL